jgi:hypothetical protein
MGRFTKYPFSPQFKHEVIYKKKTLSQVTSIRNLNIWEEADLHRKKRIPIFKMHFS